MKTAYGQNYRREVRVARQHDPVLDKVPKLELAPLNVYSYKQLITYLHRVMQTLEILPPLVSKRGCTMMHEQKPKFGYISFERFLFDFIALLGPETIECDYQ
jgi:hypothetical protein